MELTRDLHSPGSILIAYTSVGLIVYVVMTALGEMAAWIPHASGFAGYATRFCDPALGFALGQYHHHAQKHNVDTNITTRLDVLV